jgi:hypothetical protein
MSGQAAIKRAPARLLVSESELCSWLGSAAAGRVLEYYRGFLAIDCSLESGRLSNEDRAALRLVARRTQWAAERNLVHLLQRKHGLDDYTYIAVKRFTAGTGDRRDRPAKGVGHAR